MLKPFARFVLFVVPVMFLTAVPSVAAAQSRRPTVLTTPSYDVSFGGSYVHDSAPTHMTGWLASAARRIGPSVSVVGELGRHSGDIHISLVGFPLSLLTSPTIESTTKYTETSVAAGMRWAVQPDARVLPFAQFLLGLDSRRTARSSSNGTSTTWHMQPELGMDVRLVNNICARTQIGWRYLMADAIYRNEFRASVGLVARLGK